MVLFCVSMYRFPKEFLLYICWQSLVEIVHTVFEFSIIDFFRQGESLWFVLDAFCHRPISWDSGLKVLSSDRRIFVHRTAVAPFHYVPRTWLRTLWLYWLPVVAVLLSVYFWRHKETFLDCTSLSETNTGKCCFTIIGTRLVLDGALCCCLLIHDYNSLRTYWIFDGLFLIWASIIRLRAFSHESEEDLECHGSRTIIMGVLGTVLVDVLINLSWSYGLLLLGVLVMLVPSCNLNKDVA